MDESELLDIQAAWSDLLPADLRLMDYLPSDCVVGDRLDVRRLLELGYEVTVDSISAPQEPGGGDLDDDSSGPSGEVFDARTATGIVWEPIVVARYGESGPWIDITGVEAPYVYDAELGRARSLSESEIRDLTEE